MYDLIKNLDLELYVNSEGRTMITTFEPESGESYRMDFGINETADEIAERIGREIYSWIELMKDEVEYEN